MTRLIIKDDFDLMVDKIQSLWLLKGTKKETNEDEFLVCALMNGQDTTISLDNSNLVILNLDESKSGFKLRKHALKFKRLLERELCDTSKSIIFIEDLLEETIMYFQHTQLTDSNMTDMRNIFMEDDKIIDKTKEPSKKKKTRELH